MVLLHWPDVICHFSREYQRMQSQHYLFRLLFRDGFCTFAALFPFEVFGEGVPSSSSASSSSSATSVSSSPSSSLSSTVVSLLGALELDSAFARPTALCVFLPDRVIFAGGEGGGEVCASSVSSTVLARVLVLDVSALLRFLVGGGDDGCGDDAFDGAFDGGGELEILKVSLLLEKSNVSPS
jgi:hypothetical protein